MTVKPPELSECTICYEYRPLVKNNDCDHAFCSTCFDELAKANQPCPFRDAALIRHPATDKPHECHKATTAKVSKIAAKIIPAHIHTSAATEIPVADSTLPPSAWDAQKTTSKDTNLHLFDLLTAVLDLVKMGLLKEAFKKACGIENERVKSIAFIDISNSYVKQNKVKNALKITMEIPSQRIQSVSLRDISQACVSRDDIEEALKIAADIPDRRIQSVTLRDISQACVSRDDIEEALKIAVDIPGRRIRSVTLRDISLHCVSKGDVEKALEIAMMIPNEDIQSITFEDISEKK